MKSLAVLATLSLVTFALLMQGPPIGVFGRKFYGGPAAKAGTAALEKQTTIIAEPVTVPATELNGLTPAGAWVLTADNKWFGGLSGLLIEGDRMIAASDRAHLLRADLSVEQGQLETSDATLWHLRDAADRLLDGKEGDAESLARSDGHLLISFERDHRIERLDASGLLQPWMRPPGFADLSNNGGIEALASLRDGRVLAIAEDPVDDLTLWWLLDQDNVIDQGTLALAPPHRVTGSTIDPEGRLYLVLRDFSVARGVSIRIQRLTLEQGRPSVSTLETLAAFENLSGIDNMEGIAISDGFLWIIADNNFNPGQRTLLLRFKLD
ncbi:MAG: esterase-like activity of phytase family protein [Pseudomonadota bacterium]